MKTNEMTEIPLVKRLFEPIPAPVADAGSYDQKTQTWTHRSPALHSPVKHCQEE